jgi:hypothetical protein
MKDTLKKYGKVSKEGDPRFNLGSRYAEDTERKRNRMI